MEPQRRARVLGPEAVKIGLAVFTGLGVFAVLLWATGHAAFFHSADSKGFLRFARDPIPGPAARFSGTHGDTTYHFARVLLPAAAWMLAAFRAEAVGWTLVLVNTAALAAVFAVAAELLERAGRRAELSLHLAWFPGLWMLYAMVYSELTALALLMLTILLWADDRRRATLVVASLVPLAREVAVIGLVPLVCRDARRGGARRAAQWAWCLVPTIVWWSAVWARMGAVPPLAHSDFRHGVVGFPGAGLLSSLHRNGVGWVFVVVAVECALVVVGSVFVWFRRRHFPFAGAALCFAALVACLDWRGTYYVLETLRHSTIACVMIGLCLLLGKRSGDRSERARPVVVQPDREVPRAGLLAERVHQGH